MTCRPRRPTAVLELLFIALLSSCSHDRRISSPERALENLYAAEPELRHEAAVQLLEYADDPVIVVPVLIEASRESDHGALRAMLRLLGASGALEALGLIQLHAQSPARDLRLAARKALRVWLTVNRMPEAYDELVEPPHSIHERPLLLSPDRPAGHSLPARMSYPAGTLPPGPTLPPPHYEPPAPHGIPPGFTFERSQRRGLIIAGPILFGATYSATASAPMVSTLAGGDLDETAWLAVPIAGPWVYSATLFAYRYRGDYGFADIGGGLLIVAGFAQLAGLTMITVDLAYPKWKLSPRLAPDVAVTPSGAALEWAF